MRPRDLSDHVEYRAGGGIEEVAREYDRDPGEFVKLASNENPLGPSSGAVEAMRETADDVGSYPKASHADLVAAIADRWGLADEQVWLANGADGAIDYLCRATMEPDDRVLVPDPGFAYYAMSARYHHGTTATYRLSKDDGFEQTPETVLSAYDGERVVFLTTPHNPTGSELALSDVREIAGRTAEETLVVVDEAYGEFTDANSAVDLVERRDDVAVLRTFSKAYGLAGLRLGYALVPGEWADAYRRVNTPFAAGEMACRAGLAALDDDEHVRRTVETVERSRRRLREEIDARTFESGGNFVLVDVGAALDGDHEDAPGTYVADRLEREGVIVRDTSSFGLPDCVRITCGTEDETERAIATINEVLRE